VKYKNVFFASTTLPSFFVGTIHCAPKTLLRVKVVYIHCSCTCSFLLFF